MTPLPASRALDQFFLEARCRLLDLAAILDRLDRGAGTVDGDPRMKRVEQAVKELLSSTPDRAKRIQEIFSLEYEPAWKKPQPRF